MIPFETFVLKNINNINVQVFLVYCRDNNPLFNQSNTFFKLNNRIKSESILRLLLLKNKTNERIILSLSLIYKIYF